MFYGFTIGCSTADLSSPHSDDLRSENSPAAAPQPAAMGGYWTLTPANRTGPAPSRHAHGDRQPHHQRDDQHKNCRLKIRHPPHGAALGFIRGPLPALYPMGLHPSRIDLRQFPPASSRSNNFASKVPDAREWTAPARPSPQPGAVFDHAISTIAPAPRRMPRACSQPIATSILSVQR